MAPQPQPHGQPPSAPQLKNMHRMMRRTNRQQRPHDIETHRVDPGLARTTPVLVELLCAGDAPDAYDGTFVEGVASKVPVEMRERKDMGDLWARRALAVVRERVQKRRTSPGSRSVEEGGGVGEGTGEG
ncbi:hypothetical protein H2248_011284 [Termitomyces sp. 'cryptogamus']|nr:hypothetical protein H2248_011284 [Termitomyces sp. 'cryptogamus']